MNRKNTAYLKIIVWSVVAVALAVLLVLGVIFGSRSSLSFIGFDGSYYKDSQKYTAGAGEVPADEVEHVALVWTSGDVEISVYDGETVRMEESAGRELSEGEKLHYFNDEGTLRIQFQESGRKFHFLSGTRDKVKKNLRLEIPRETASRLKVLSIETTSADVDVSYIQTEQMLLDTVSGDFRVWESKMEKLKWDTVSGNLDGQSLEIGERFFGDSISGNTRLSGTVKEIDLTSVSGDMKISSTQCPVKVRTDTVSGEVSLCIPEDTGFTYEMDGVSGKVYMDLPVLRNKDGGVYKDGEADFYFETVSGDVNIEKQGQTEQ